MSNVLIDAPAWVGDMVMAQVLFKLLKQQRPDIKIDVMAPTSTAPVLGCMPEIDNIVLTPFSHGELSLLKRYQFAKALRQEGYEQAILLRNSFKSAFIPFLANIQKRTGWVGESRYGLINDIRKLDTQRYPMMIQRFAALAFPKEALLPNHLPMPRFSLMKTERLNVIQKFNVSLEKPVLALCPGAEYGPSKQWPAEKLAEVANAKLQDGYQVWLMGSKKDKPIAEKIQSLTHHSCINYAGETSLFEAIYLLDLASVVVTNDSGLMHVAAALQKPIVAIYGGSSYEFTPPLCDQKKLLARTLPCRPCFKRTCQFGHYDCLNKISSDEVLKAMEEISGEVCATNLL